MMLARNRRKQNLLFGCGMLGLFSLVGVIILAGSLLRQERLAAQYPGSAHVSSHSNYKALPRELRWDDAYRTHAPFVEVYNWYANGLNLGPESKANGHCILLEATKKQVVISRHISVFLCDTRQGRMIFVARSMSVGGP